MIFRIICIAAFCILHFGLEAQTVFEINDFGATRDNLSMLGSTKIYEDRLRLTPASTGLEGAAWYQANKIDLSSGFETEFKFLISGAGAVPGDGFAFVMHNQNVSAIGGTGDAIGYKGIPYVMAIEFDTKNDGEGSKNHVNLSFYDESSGSYRRYATVHEIPEITDGQPHFTKVIYNNGALEVFLDSYIFPVLSVKIDIASKVLAGDGQVWLGFTASTSDAYANHDLLQWTLRQFGEEPEEIDAAAIEVIDANAISVSRRKIKVKVWDHNTIDGDIISLKWGDQWVLTEYQLTQEPFELELTVHGFGNSLILYANNVGQVPPNTAMISVSDGSSYFKQELNADMETSEALVIRFAGE